jgi:hypothetical protein
VTSTPTYSEQNSLYPLGLTHAQLLVVQAALLHELHRVNGRAKDDRLGDATREAEQATLAMLRGLVDRVRRLRGE